MSILTNFTNFSAYFVTGTIYIYHQDIGFSRIGPSQPTIDLALQNETVVVEQSLGPSSLKFEMDDIPCQIWKSNANIIFFKEKRHM